MRHGEQVEKRENRRNPRTAELLQTGICGFPVHFFVILKRFFDFFIWLKFASLKVKKLLRGDKFFEPASREDESVGQLLKMDFFSTKLQEKLIVVVSDKQRIVNPIKMPLRRT